MLVILHIDGVTYQVANLEGERVSLNIPVYAANEHMKIHEAAEQLYRKNFQVDLSGCLPSNSQSIVDIYETLQDSEAA